MAIRKNVPEVMEPLLRNCEKMADVLVELDKEYTFRNKLVPLVLKDLQKYKPTSNSGAQQLVYLQNKYCSAKLHLQEVRQAITIDR